MPQMQIGPVMAGTMVEGARPVKGRLQPEGSTP
jgi:hypothetical protein